ncbi:NPCBM/NEW2 domain-containing protein [Alteraurantiacibacter palmitatis]|uniref:Alpha-galactosidase n=1 Tax=Alteraurantiacibacter palmitatis TaxID=2054628 RepID=A0ABV7E6W2_9SPHN
MRQGGWNWAAGLLAATALAGAVPAVAQASGAAVEARTIDPLAATGRWSAFSGGHAPLPPMGWNSWNAFYHDIDEEKVLAAATYIVESGLAARGYRYINIDDGWWLKRDVDTGRMVINTANFPSAASGDGTTSFRPFTDRLHTMGLKVGIYSDIGRNSCGQTFGHGAANNPQGSVEEREVGLYGHVDQDIALYFGEWGFDYIKVDGCGIRGMGAGNPNVAAGIYREFEPLIDVDSIGNTNVPAVQALFGEVRDALARHNPDGDYVFSLCIWGSSDVRSWAHNFGNLSRTSEDISPHWGRMLHNLDSASRRELYAQPGNWNDPDMLFVGTGDFDANHLVEARSHFSLWAMLNAPLIIGFDMRQMTPELLAILGNEEIIALNQDAGGNQAVLAFDTDDIQIFVKTLADGSKATALFNRTSAPLDVVLTADHLKLRGDQPVALRDLWSGETSGFTGEMTLTLAPRETRVFAASGARRLDGGLYLSEMPGAINVAEDGVVEPEHDPLVHRGILPWQQTRGVGDRHRYTGWGGARADSTPHGQALRVANRDFATGIGALANSRLELRNSGFARFRAEVGVDDTSVDTGTRVRFEVHGDGRLLAQSDWAGFGEAPKRLEADVAGTQIVEIIARSESAPARALSVVWGEAALLR